MTKKQRNIIKMKSLAAKLTTRKLCEFFESTNEKDGMEIPIIRGVLMDELEARNPKAFKNFINSEDVNKINFPSLFF